MHTISPLKDLSPAFAGFLLMGVSLFMPAKADVPAEVQAVFVNNGCLGCHSGGGPSGGLSLDDAATSELELVGIDSVCDNNIKRVAPGDPANSSLYQKISQANPGCGGPMPPNGNLISQADQAVISDWIVSIGPAAEFGLVEMASATLLVAETEPELVLTVNRSLGQEGEQTVDYSVATIGTDTATSPDDYMADTGTLVFAAGEMSQTITVTLADDDVFEGSEVFSVTLTNLNGGAVLGSTAQTKVTIYGDDSYPPYSFLDSGRLTGIYTLILENTSY